MTGMGAWIDRYQPLAALAARLLIAWIFIYDGYVAIVDYAGVGDYMEANGVSRSLLPLAIIAELGGGLFVAAGLLTRLAAFALAGFCLMTALLFHAHSNDPMAAIQLYKDMAIAGGFLALVAFGAGRWSLDAMIFR